METKYTPGPWAYKVTKEMISIESKHPTEKQISNEDISIAGIWSLGKSDKANAKLIAAAPELLEALKEVIAISDRDHSAWDYAKSIIKKATE